MAGVTGVRGAVPAAPSGACWGSGPSWPGPGSSRTSPPGPSCWIVAAAGLLRADELSGRSTHVSNFASPEGWWGWRPLDLYRHVSALDGAPLLH